MSKSNNPPDGHRANTSIRFELLATLCRTASAWCILRMYVLFVCSCIIKLPERTKLLQQGSIYRHTSGSRRSNLERPTLFTCTSAFYCAIILYRIEGKASLDVYKQFHTNTLILLFLKREQVKLEIWKNRNLSFVWEVNFFNSIFNLSHNDKIII